MPRKLDKKETDNLAEIIKEIIALNDELVKTNKEVNMYTMMNIWADLKKVASNYKTELRE